MTSARQRWVLVVVVLAALAAGAVVGWRRAQSAASSVLPSCETVFSTQEPEAVDHHRERWSTKVGEPGEGESVIEIAETPPDVTWHYRAEVTVPRYHAVVEGEYRPGMVDERAATWQPPGAPEPFQRREVIVGDEAWVDHPDKESWNHCRDLGLGVADSEMDVTIGTESLDPEGVGCGWSCTYMIGRGSRVRVGNPVSSVVDGEPVTTYEVRGVVRPAFTEEEERLRATITVDGERRLRGAKVWDAVTGAVYLTMTAGPAPGNPPIVDPSDQPRFSQQPPPPPPPTETVPVTPAPAG